ncbi:Lrp/AsnC family transcriptional regulator [Bacillus paranthracis]|uniref:Lrp/AsnC family transcriptional regulator n=1 Tax=Bacillus TaxID=1386 RepID=UPI000977A763|nr:MULTISPECIES: Lrp/AsnC family transcriptional regulator [Bacillus cereus group]MDA2666424.1 Lrp/AsnC family transcriptional regulator [Bacillus cereus group sp. Bc032]MDA2677154.1 Lrp/AsnC family transcriptional regulator [Bacillus cereus group sp. Bc031]MDA2682651.1 Lrp/AsnC family transcriptional regulator [Bacillus cereus group sp. Bc029]MDA2688098.1 Lrp/AsnC family transcriptional regulator [Bacillus cereus group sp. Bc030]MDA2743600.1 Lrp/AsnC family transcriptional regulator [Bacillus
MDKIDRKIIEFLQIDGRMTVLQLSKELNLSRPAINERIKKLQDSNVIQGFTTKISPEAIGKEIIVMIEVNNVKVECHKFEELIQDEYDIVECHRITGQSSYIMKAIVPNMKRVRELIDRLIPFAQLNTSVVLSSPIQNRLLLPDETTN